MTPAELKTKLAAQAREIDRVMRDDLLPVTEAKLAAVLEHALFAGGKRIRPLLTLLAADLAAGAGAREAARHLLPRSGPAHGLQHALPSRSLQAAAPRERRPANGHHSPATAEGAGAIPALAIAFEYLHAASLLHDDVIDHADQRRGRVTVNQRWDNGAAILAGDFLHARALLLAGRAGGAACLELIGSATQAMVASEFIQEAAAACRDWREQTYYAVLEGKTAALIAAACAAGATAANGDDEQCQALHTYGANLGLAFQIIDDLLDYLGDPRATGKAVGNDLQEGKMTLPLLLAHRRATPEQQRQLEEILAADPARRVEQLESVREIMTATEAFAASRREAEKLIAAGEAALAIFPAGESRDLLAALGHYVLVRDK